MTTTTTNDRDDNDDDVKTNALILFRLFNTLEKKVY